MHRPLSRSKNAVDSGAMLRTGLAVLGAAGAGAALMYFLDPQRGRRRRVLARDKVNRITHKTTGTVGATSRDLRNRALGIMAETRSLVSRRQVSDEVLAERVRARLGSLVSHASSIQVWSDNGRVTLSGGVLAAELPRLMRGVSSIRGVTGIENLLTVQESSESLSGHYARSRWPQSRSTFDKLRKPWTETTR
ncbi:MAG TPA: BON domain-containing protein, partial [Gammaproteobacteria bacterium]|nr:BON domain-containing protein [Gammaproteobacteria bacterium]